MGDDTGRFDHMPIRPSRFDHSLSRFNHRVQMLRVSVMIYSLLVVCKQNDRDIYFDTNYSRVI